MKKMKKKEVVSDHSWVLVQSGKVFLHGKLRRHLRDKHGDLRIKVVH